MRAGSDKIARAPLAGMARVRDIKLAPVLASAFPAHAIIQAYEAARSLASEHERFRDKLAKGVLELVESGFAIGADAYDDARRTASQARRALSDLMTEVDVILSPSAPGAPPKGLRSTGSPTLNPPWPPTGTPSVHRPG